MNEKTDLNAVQAAAIVGGSYFAASVCFVHRENGTWTPYKRRLLWGENGEDIYAAIPFTCRLCRHFASETVNGGTCSARSAQKKQVGDCLPVFFGAENGTWTRTV